VKRAFQKTYGKEHGERAFYASENKGTIQGVTKDETKKKKPQGRR
jgi:hypothetical protein